MLRSISEISRGLSCRVGNAGAAPALSEPLAPSRVRVLPLADIGSVGVGASGSEAAEKIPGSMPAASAGRTIARFCAREPGVRSAGAMSSILIQEKRRGMHLVYGSNHTRTAL